MGMARKRPRTVPPSHLVPADFTVKAEDKIEANQIEHDAWSMFLKWCSAVPGGTKVELMRGDRVVAWLTTVGAPSPLGCRAMYDATHQPTVPVLVNVR
jgi:hypothetical protein